MNPEKNIVLCGFMGSGKSTVGKILSQRLTAQFIDMDTYIEDREGTTISDIFERLGEQGFRKREREAVLELAKMRGIVLAAGGGALTSEKNVEALRRTGVILFLDVGFAECYRRIENSDRPLLRSNTREELRRLYLSRQEAYRRAADFEMSSGGPPEKVAEAAVKLLGLE